jgi:hypothetical protein
MEAPWGGPSWAPRYRIPEGRGTGHSETRTTESNARQRADDRRDIRPHPGGLVEAGWLIGTRVYDGTGKDLGKIEHLDREDRGPAASTATSTKC